MFEISCPQHGIFMILDHSVMVATNFMVSPTERGTFMALTFGENHVKIKFISLNEEPKFHEHRIYPLPDKVKSSTAGKVSYNDVIYVT